MIHIGCPAFMLPLSLQLLACCLCVHGVTCFILVSLSISGDLSASTLSAQCLLLRLSMEAMFLADICMPQGAFHACSTCNGLS